MKVIIILGLISSACPEPYSRTEEDALDLDGCVTQDSACSVPQVDTRFPAKRFVFFSLHLLWAPWQLLLLLVPGRKGAIWRTTGTTLHFLYLSCSLFFVCVCFSFLQCCALASHSRHLVRRKSRGERRRLLRDGSQLCFFTQGAERFNVRVRLDASCAMTFARQLPPRPLCVWAEWNIRSLSNTECRHAGCFFLTHLKVQMPPLGLICHPHEFARLFNSRSDAFRQGLVVMSIWSVPACTPTSKPAVSLVTALQSSGFLRLRHAVVIWLKGRHLKLKNQTFRKFIHPL